MINQKCKKSFDEKVTFKDYKDSLDKEFKGDILGHPTKSGWGLIYPLQILWIPPTDFAVEQKLKFQNSPPKGTHIYFF